MRVALIIIFNHKFNKNISMLYKLYSSRFRIIRFLVPFYEGNDSNVITVYESSYQFQGYIAQARHELEDLDCTHYLFIGDDLILNPEINEENICEYLNLNEESCYIESLTPLKQETWWTYRRFSDADIAFQSKAVNYQSEIPSYEEAMSQANKYGLHDFRIHGLFKSYKYGIKHPRMCLVKWFNMLFNPVDIKYPLVAGYSDFFVLSKGKFERFVKLSGVFSAMRLFVEVAIPTTLMLINEPDELKMQKDIKKLTPQLWSPSELVKDFEERCGFEIEKMLKCWPDEYVYLHPVKLSRWKMEE